MNQQEVKGRPIGIEVATTGAPAPTYEPLTVFVSNLSFAVTDDQLKELFSKVCVHIGACHRACECVCVNMLACMSVRQKGNGVCYYCVHARKRVHARTRTRTCACMHTHAYSIRASACVCICVRELYSV